MEKDIERILRDIKVDDNHIVLDENKKWIIAGIEIEVFQVNWFYKWIPFSRMLGTFLNYYISVCENFKLPDGIGDIIEFRKNLRLTLSNTIWGKLAMKELIKMCLFSSNIKLKIIKKNFGLDDWITLFFLVYAYNVLGVKKNLKTVLQIIKKG